MENHLIKNKKDVSKYSRDSLGLMTDLVESKYPSDERDTYSKLVNLINKEFDMNFTEDDLVNQNILGMEIEDRILTYKHATGYDGSSYQYRDINGESAEG
jgi:hypothetical protein